MANLPSTAAHPFVSIIIPAYNAEIFIEKTLNSILMQTYCYFEVLIVDDGSQDRTSEIVDRIAETDSRVILIKQKNSGVAAARNLAIQAAKGELIAPIDADDIWYPNYLEKQVCCLQSCSDAVGLVYAWSIDIDEQEQLTGGLHAAQIQGNVYQTLLCHNFLGNASATVIRKTCFETVGGYCGDMRAQNAQGCEDWDLYLRVAEKYEFRVVPEFLVGYRKIQQSMSCNYDCMARSHSFMLQSNREKYPEIPAFLYHLSSSSFYLYFAHQSHVWGDDRTTQFWLSQAIKVDKITPFLRLSFYQLFLKSFVGQMLASRLSTSKKSPISTQTKEVNSPLIEDLRLKIFIKVLVGNLLHTVLSRIGKPINLQRSPTPMPECMSECMPECMPERRSEYRSKFSKSPAADTHPNCPPPNHV
ncbi:MAG: glycosyltransferase family 2 protein [Leptolyngbyaceae cyanobacterium CSU_1_3]|nr:glycosyltransferase family 2 protein [Leptolyngbyaceae cyanobacterium CSU_1_3]